jgi:AcrR family transcriptional regulator
VKLEPAARSSRAGKASTASAADDASTARPRRTHAERREEAEHRLLEAALGIVAQRGTARMTLAEVAEAAGYSRGLPTHRFGNKAGLVHALAGYIGERFGEQRRQGPASEPGLPAIVATIRFYFARTDAAWTSTRALLVMMVEACMSPGPATTALREEVAAYNRGALAWFEQHVRRGIELGNVDPAADPASTAVVLLGAMRGAMLQALVDPRIRLPMVRDRLVAIAEAALRPPPGRDGTGAARKR